MQFDGSFAIDFFAKNEASSSFVFVIENSRVASGQNRRSLLRHSSNVSAIAFAFVIPVSLRRWNVNSLFIAAPFADPLIDTSVRRRYEEEQI
jgi:hypothetical protein